MAETLSFFIVLFVGVFFSELFIRLHLPWVVALILGGILVGPHGLGFFEPNETIEFLSQIGLVFLMFMAGLETKLSGFYSLRRGNFTLPLINGGLPFFVGFGIALYFGYELTAALLLGIIFISSSVAVIIPSLQSHRLTGTRLGRSIISTTVLEDITSLVLLSLLLQVTNPLTGLPLPLFYVALFLILVALRWVIARVRTFFAAEAKEGHDLFQLELRSILVILIGTVISFELLGLHPIVAGFFAGLVLSDSITSDMLKEKLRAISYGIFIPIFFVVVGTKTDLGVFVDVRGVLVFAAVTVAALMLAKFFGGMLAGRMNGFSAREGAFIGAATIPQLSTSLAVVFTGLEFGIVGSDLVSVLVALTVVTTLVSPLLMRAIGGFQGHKLSATPPQA